jgi:hypothetical protein
MCDSGWLEPDCLDHQLPNITSIVYNATGIHVQQRLQAQLVRYHEILAAASDHGDAMSSVVDVPLNTSVVDLHNGNYTIAMNPVAVKAGRYCVNSTFIGNEIAPVDCFTVIPAQTASNTSIIIGNGIEGGFMYCEQRRFGFIIEARDIYSNRKLDGNDVFDVTVISNTNASYQIATKTTNMQNGRYLIEYDYKMGTNHPEEQFTTLVELNNPGGHYNGPIDGGNNITTIFKPSMSDVRTSQYIHTHTHTHTERERERETRDYPLTCD